MFRDGGEVPTCRSDPPASRPTGRFVIVNAVTGTWAPESDADAMDAEGDGCEPERRAPVKERSRA